VGGTNRATTPYLSRRPWRTSPGFVQESDVAGSFVWSAFCRSVGRDKSCALWVPASVRAGTGWALDHKSRPMSPPFLQVPFARHTCARLSRGVLLIVRGWEVSPWTSVVTADVGWGLLAAGLVVAGDPGGGLMPLALYGRRIGTCAIVARAVRSPHG
jgi:hypothetical protein